MPKQHYSGLWNRCHTFVFVWFGPGAFCIKQSGYYLELRSSSCFPPMVHNMGARHTTKFHAKFHALTMFLFGVEKLQNWVYAGWHESLATRVGCQEPSTVSNAVKECNVLLYLSWLLGTQVLNLSKSSDVLHFWQ